MPAATELRADLPAVVVEAQQALARLVRIPSVSSDPARSAQMQESADAVAALLRGAGLLDVELLRAEGGHPAVIGHRAAPAGAPTVLLYAHHDVQPAGDEASWHSEPFVAVERDGRLFGRGAADDKAGVVLHCAALRLLGDRVPVGVTVLVEGEEEVGSPTLPALLAAHRDRLAADVLVLADSTNWQVGVPALTTTLRGGLNVVVEVRTLSHAVHNGVYGGPVPDALTVLVRLLSTLHDDDGRVAVDGLTHGTAGDVDFPEERLRADAGVLDGVALLGTGPLTDRLWHAPAITVIGLDAPDVDRAPMTIAPRARAKLTLRVGSGDDADAARDALVAHLERNAPWGAHVTVTPGKTVQPFAARTDGAAYAAARDAFTDAWGTAPVHIGVGGSIDFVGTFAREFPDAEILITGVEDPDTRAHAANESLHLGDFASAVLAEALFLSRLGVS